MRIPTPIQSPLFILVDHDLNIFASAENAEAYLEPADREQISGFDRDARVLHATVAGTASVPHIHLELDKDFDPDRDAMKRMIVSQLRQIRSIHKQPFIQKEWEIYNLDELIDLCVNLFGYS